MSHLEIILPFAIPPAPLAPDLLRELRVPALSTMIGKSHAKKPIYFDDFSRQLAHEYWLADGFTAIDGVAITDSIFKDTLHRMQAYGLTVDTGYWFMLSPVHIHIARDHLVLTDQRRLNLHENEARLLFAEAAALCAEVGHTLLYGDARTWFLRADDWHDFQTASMDAACGHNVDIWTARGAQALAWRKLQNEIQMQWFIHPLNAEREARGDKVVNSVWLSGGAKATPSILNPLTLPTIHPSTSTLAELLVNGDKDQRVVLDQLLEPALNSDWGAWLEHMDVLEKTWFAPSLAALRDGQRTHLTHFTITATNANTVAQFSLNRWRLRQFWQPASLQKLFSLAAV